MKSRFTSRPKLSSFTFVFVGLSLAVFTWGLQYKLSLYDPPQSVSHRMVEAKLLSRNEQTIESDRSLVSNFKAAAPEWSASGYTVFILSLVVLAPLRKPSAPHEGVDAERPWRIRYRASLDPFFFRPPPTLY
jgi:hypothetical protein